MMLHNQRKISKHNSTDKIITREFYIPRTLEWNKHYGNLKTNWGISHGLTSSIFWYMAFSKFLRHDLGGSSQINKKIVK